MSAGHKEQIDQLKALNPVVGRDQSASVRCPKHGRHCFAYFVRGNGVQPQYICGHCWGELPIQEHRPLYSPEEATKMQAEIDASRNAVEAAFDLAVGSGDWPW